MMYALEAINITKVYPNGIVANKNVSISVEIGKIHAIVGENGAGKTTLMRIFFGMEKPTSGEIKVFGKKVNLNSPKDAIALNIGMVHQHFMLVPSFTVIENIILGIEPRKGLFTVDFEKARRIVTKYMEKLNFQVPLEEKVMDLPVGVKQRVEILKALIRNAKILILDEPSSVLTPQETKELFNVLKNLVRFGITVIFITHKLNEVKQIADKITIMRDGRVVGTYDNNELSESDIVKLMVGKKFEHSIKKVKRCPGKILLEVRNLNYFREDGVQILKNISFSLRAGEILGIAGLEGNGQKELVEILTGLRENATGEIYVDGINTLNAYPWQIRKMKVAYIPEDRIEIGCAPDLSIAENLVSNRCGSNLFFRTFLYRKKQAYQFSQEIMREFSIKAESPRTVMKMLSGGNIQKVILAREMTVDARIIIASQPTHGIDVASSELIRKKLLQMRNDGKAILLISTDLQEILQISDRILVFYRGEITAHFQNENLTEAEIGYYMLGIRREKTPLEGSS